MDNQSSIFLILLAPACGWCAGLGFFRTLLALAVLHRFAPGGTLPGGLGLLSHSAVFWIAIGLGAIEIVADAIPRFDTKWNRWNGPLRVIGGGTLAWFAASGQSVEAQVTFAIIAVFLALVVHSIHSGARLAAWRSGTSNIVTPVTSVTELCMIFATLLPLSATPALTMLMLGFMSLAVMMVAYLVWPCVSQAMMEVFTFRRSPEPETTPTS